MTIAQYQELTGTTVPASKQSSVTAQIRRSRANLEALLGYTLDKKKVNDNQYEELGKTQNECGCVSDINEDELLDADTVTNAYRLYPYNPDDRFLSTDPFTKLHSVKLVMVRPGIEGKDGITIKTFDNEDLRVAMKNGFSKYIERCEDCLCLCSCRECVQLAVDADWLYDACLPDDLLYLWAEMVTYEINCKKDIKSESLGSHSYTKFDRKIPQDLPQNITLLQKYAGPNGLARPKLTI